jgi:DNA polymerase-3 subunit gamma/tau
MAYYRTYRPQKIADLDSAKLRETLNALLSSKDLPHAFLFTGPKGLGKTSTARIIAKSVNCEKREDGNAEPCNECEVCLSITNGSNIDVLEIDGASNRGIDEIRDLREKVKITPAHAKKKVYIIDEVHMLTTEAFNALLKTIEEPPTHVMFIFCTTEPQKVPATILSRCFHFALAKATQEELIHSLKRIVTGEKITIEQDALALIAEMADGGFRDAAKLLEEIILLGDGKEISRIFLESHLQLTNSKVLLNSLLQTVREKDAKKSLIIIQHLVDQGTDIKFVLLKVLETLHNLLLIHSGIKKEEPAFTFTLSEIQMLVLLFQQAYKDAKYAVIPQLPLELAVVIWCEQEKEAVLSSVASIPSKKVTLDLVIKKEKNLKVQQILKPQEKKAEVQATFSVKQEDISNADSGSAQVLENIIYKVKPLNHSLAGLLRGCTLTKMEEQDVFIETAYKFHKEKIMETKNIVMLEKALKELTGKEMRVVVELKN